MNENMIQLTHHEKNKEVIEPLLPAKERKVSHLDLEKNRVKDRQRINDLTEELKSTFNKDSNLESPASALALARQEAFSIQIRPEDYNSEGKLLAIPGGAESNLSEENWKLVRTESFKKWFGNSNVVDENGEPALVHHTTNADFNSFSREENKKKETYTTAGYYFTSTNTVSQNSGYGKNRLSVFLNAMMKDVNYHDIHNLQKGTEEYLKSKGYTGMIYSYDSKEKYIENQKQDFRKVFAPRSLADKLSFIFRKAGNHLIGHERDPKDLLSDIKRDTRSLRRDRSTAKSNFEEIVVFDPGQIMVVDKEENYRDKFPT